MSDHYYPGCYGSPLCYRAGMAVCVKCPYNAECKIAAAERSARLAAKYGIEDTMRVSRSAPTNDTSRSVHMREKKAASKPVDPPSGSRPGNQKAAELIDRLKQRGVDLKTAIQNGQNPFQESRTPAFMRIAFDHLLGGAGIERASLSKAFVDEFSWTPGSATSHVSIAFSALLHSGAAIEIDGRLMANVMEAA